MHDIAHLLACILVKSELKATAVSLACCCKNFEDTVLDVLWATQERLIPLLKCFPQEVWMKEDWGYFVSQGTVFGIAISTKQSLAKAFPEDTNESGVVWLPKICSKNAETHR